MEIPKAPLKRMLKEEGAERVSEAAAELMAKKTERFVKEVGRKAATLAKLAKRKTVTEKDVEMAVGDVWR